MPKANSSEINPPETKKDHVINSSFFRWSCLFALISLWITGSAVTKYNKRIRESAYKKNKYGKNRLEKLGPIISAACFLWWFPVINLCLAAVIQYDMYILLPDCTDDNQ